MEKSPKCSFPVRHKSMSVEIPHQSPKAGKTIWSFDLGKASIGEAVRDPRTNEFLHVASLLIPPDFASTQAAANRRRMWRTRQAHKAREAWLDEVWRAAQVPGLPEPLRKRVTWRDPLMNKWTLKHPADERLEREFPAKGDETCYTSCLLRIKLLRGEKLEPWQIYKALHSAIQRRGYDPDIPWKARESGRREKAGEDEEGVTRERMQHFVEELTAMSPEREEFHLPCYFDAWKMGLWRPEEPEALRLRIDCRAESTRDRVVPRWLVEKEIRLLADAAGDRIEGFRGKAAFLLWGPAEKPYASYDVALRKQLGLREGGTGDWKGVVGQKIPRFDNRIIEKCALIPRLNVCKIKSDGKGHPHEESRIVFEATFLMKLKNMRVQRATTEQTGLTAEEIRAVFEDPKITGYKVTEAQWRKLCAKFGAQPLPSYETVDAPRGGGRSRFCRPALELLKRLILSGESPLDFHRAELARRNGNTDPQRGLVAEDLNFLTRMGATWEGIHVPNQKLEAIVQMAETPEDAIGQIIGSQNDPIVRHRLTLFAERLAALRDAHGVPAEVVIEFVREDFMGKKAVIEYRSFLKKREADRKLAREDAVKVGATERSAGLKLELLRAQGGICLYTGEGLKETNLDAYEIDHIVPRSKGGPDAVINYVLTTHQANFDKDERTPFEWLAATDGWSAYEQRVRSRHGALRNKKVKLLLDANAAELASRYTALAETAWIAKLSQALVDVFFDWKNGVDASGRKRVRVVNGGLTARIRRKYKLNSLLNPAAMNEEEAEKKNRDDDRHHALDAMVINFIPQWTRDAAKEHFFRLPDGVNRENFAAVIETVMPRNVCLEKPVLAETIYGARGMEGKKVIVQRAEVQSLAYKPINPSKSVYDLAYATKQCKSIRDEHIRGLILHFIHEEPPEEGWKEFCASLCLRKLDGTPGSRITHVTMNVGEATEYADLSKDGAGAWRKAKKGHKGQIVYHDSQGKPKIRPVYAFEGIKDVEKSIILNGGTVYGFFRTGCLVQIAKPIAHDTTPLAPGIYRLNTMKTVGQAKVTDIGGRPSFPINITKFIEAQLRPLQALEILEQSLTRSEQLRRSRK
jgi:CRISPR-associated endonuclease Csn1